MFPSMSAENYAVRDPHLKKILAIMNSLPPSTTVEERRANFARLCSFAGEPDPSVACREEIVLGGRNLRFYEPASPSSRALLLYFHGGGFVAGGLDTHLAPLTHLASLSKTRIAHLAYRRAPEHRFPAAFEDGLGALDYLTKNLSALGLDLLLVGGDSAGGNLAAALAAERPEAIAGQILLYPTLDAQFRGESWRRTPPGLIASAEDSAAFNRLYARGPVDYDDPRFSPLYRKDLSGLPPARLFVGALDAARSDSEAYADLLRVFGVDAKADVLPDLTHGFFTMGGEQPAARAALDRIAGVLRGIADK